MPTYVHSLRTEYTTEYSGILCSFSVDVRCAMIGLGSMEILILVGEPLRSPEAPQQ